MLKIGWAERDITPTRPVILRGQMYLRVAHKACDPITVTAWAVEDVVIVSCDLGAINEELRQAVLHRLPADVPPQNVILSATHTHDSLNFDDRHYAHPGGDVMTGAECLAFVAERIAGVIAEARQKRTPRSFARAFGRAVIGHNRYAVYANNAGQMYGQTNRPDFRHIGGYEDHSVDMLFTWNSDGQLAGVVVVVPCPSQVEEHLTEISADYWHEVRVELRRRYGQQLHILGLCAPAGDQSPHFLLYKREEEAMRQRRGVTERQEIAQRIAAAVERALASTKPDESTPTFRHVTRELKLPPFRITKKYIPWTKARLDEWVAERSETSSWWPRHLQRVIDIANGVVKPETVSTRIHVVRVGDFCIATNPFELFLDYSLRIKTQSPAAQTILVQLAGPGTYLPSERAVVAGSYGASPVSCPVGPQGGKKLVAATLTAINKLFKEK